MQKQNEKNICVMSVTFGEVQGTYLYCSTWRLLHVYSSWSGNNAQFKCQGQIKPNIKRSSFA